MTTKTPIRAPRVYTPIDAEIAEALAAATEAELVPADAPVSARLHAWVMYGFRQWLARRDEAAKFTAYAQIAAEEGRQELLDAYLDHAIEAGIV